MFLGPTVVRALLIVRSTVCIMPATAVMVRPRAINVGIAFPWPVAAHTWTRLSFVNPGRNVANNMWVVICHSALASVTFALIPADTGSSTPMCWRSQERLGGWALIETIVPN